MSGPQPCERVIVGAGRAIGGAHTDLAIRIAGVARALGFTCTRVLVSRVRGSCSRYVSAIDARNRCWTLRISSHRRPNDARVPHFELISCDGLAGFDEAAAFLGRVAAGVVQWFDAEEAGRMISPRQRRRWGRRS